MAVEHLWSLAALDPEPLDRLALHGDDPALPSRFRVGTVAASTIATMALACTECYRERTGKRQQVDVDVRRALAAFRSERMLRVDGAPPAFWGAISGFYQAGDDRWIQLHTNFAHHRDGVLKLLGCADDRAEVAAAIRDWRAAELDAALAEAGMCASLVRTPNEWRALAQAQAIGALPLIEIERIGDAPPEPIGGGVAAARPLSGVRVLDLSRIIAGPVAGRALAQHGADVLLVNGPHLPNIPELVIDTGRGKRSTLIDLREHAGCSTLRTLARDADVFLQAYRPGSLDARGFSAQALADMRPGIVYVSVCAYSHRGPWATRRGFDSLVQSASGIAYEEARAIGSEQPKHLPCQALDHGAGYLAAFGAMTALLRRAQAGGSWHVRVSLAQVGAWLTSFGEIEGGERTPDVPRDALGDCLLTRQSAFGKLGCVSPAERLSDTQPYDSGPPVPIGTDEPVWLAG
jgi:crotonobetainyl-CoA:carnitine CoA-transferase CaiB-like acyl-CoA transferase